MNAPETWLLLLGICLVLLFVLSFLVTPFAWRAVDENRADPLLDPGLDTAPIPTLAEVSWNAWDSDLLIDYPGPQT